MRISADEGGSAADRLVIGKAGDLHLAAQAAVKVSFFEN
jgi:hypothetical protein